MRQRTEQEPWVGTFLVGTVRASYQDLVRTFGLPSWRDDTGGLGDEKVRAEWDLSTERGDEGVRAGERITLYDWKEWVPLEEVTEWHIGASYHGEQQGLIGRLLEQSEPEAKRGKR